MRDATRPLQGTANLALTGSTLESRSRDARAAPPLMRLNVSLSLENGQHMDRATKRTKTAVLVDPHHMVRDAIKEFLALDFNIKTSGETGDGLVALELVRRLDPDLVILDIDLPSLDGVDLIAMMRRRSLAPKILVLSASDNALRADAAFRAGADAYVSKASAMEILSDALSALHNDTGPYRDPCLNDRHGSPQPAPIELVPRERQILKLISEGLSGREIAEKLAISGKTVESHRLNLGRKLGARSAGELLKWALRLRLTTL